MENMRDYITSIRKGLETFSAHITHATMLYKRKLVQSSTTSETLQPLDDFDEHDQSSSMGITAEATTATSMNENDLICNTMGMSIDSFAKVMLDMAKDGHETRLVFRKGG